MDSTPDRPPWHRVRSVFLAALEYPSAERAAFLDQACAGDVALRREVLSLLEADGATGPLDDLAGALAVSPADEASDEGLTGRRIGPFEVLSEIGRGGMGVVYKARDVRLDRYVALKFLPVHLGARPAAKARFMQEARAASALDHPNIYTIYDIGETDPASGSPERRLYIAMAYYGGATVKEVIERGPMSVDDSLRIALQVADGLARAHEAGIVHRDVKPSNLILTERGDVRILDFGVAKLESSAVITRPGTQVGTVAYMAPEQTAGDTVDHRTDVWALGVVLYEMLTGRRPFAGDVTPAVLYAIRHDAPIPVQSLRPDVPDDLACIIERTLAKDPSERFDDMTALHVALGAVLSRRSSSASIPHAPSPSLRRGRRRTPGVYAGGGVLLLALVALLVWWVAEGGGSGFEDDRLVRSIAVLPLENQSGNPEQEYFADGMTDALIADLGRIESLRVISRTSVMQYKNTDQSLPEIARALDVAAVVEGAVQPAGDRVGITVRLVDAASDRVMWTRRYERELRDVLALQREVALAIAQEIQAELTPREEARLARVQPVDPEAYRLYLWGHHFRNRETPADWEQAAVYFERSIARDSTFAPAYAGLARVYTQAQGGARAEEARRAARHALALDPDLSDAYVSLGLVQEMLDWDWEGAGQAFRQAIQLNPGDGEAHHERGLLLMRRGRFEDALQEVRHALDLDPLSIRFHNGVAAVYLFSREYEAALDWLNRSLALEPDNGMTYWRLGQVYQEQGRLSEAVEAFERMVALGGVQASGHLGHALAAAGRPDAARRLLADLQSQQAPIAAGGTPWIAYNLALVHAGLGETNQALDWLERAYAVRSNLLMYLNVVPAFDPLRDEARFQDLLQQVGLRRSVPNS